MISLLTDPTSLFVKNQQGKSSKTLGLAIERLSNGLRINGAKDDAAGQAISNRMSAQITGMNQAARNVNDGISAIQVGDGAINEMNENLLQIRTLTVQAQNETNSSSDLFSIQNELDQRLAEINRLSEQTNFNGINLLAKTGAMSIQIGANDNEYVDIPLQKITTSTLRISDLSIRDITTKTQDNSLADANYLTNQGYVAGSLGSEGVTTYKLTGTNATANTTQILERIATQSSQNYSKGMVSQDSAGRVDLSDQSIYYYSSIENNFHKALTLDRYIGNISGLPVGSSGAEFYVDGSSKILVSYKPNPNGYFYPIKGSQIDGGGIVTADVSLIPPITGLSLSKLSSLGGYSNIGESSTFAVPNDAPSVSNTDMKTLFESKGGYAFIRLQESPTLIQENYRMNKSGGALNFDQYIGGNSNPPSTDYKKVYSERITGLITTDKSYEENVVYEQADKRITTQVNSQSAQIFINANSKLTEASTSEIVVKFPKTEQPLGIIDSAINAIDKLRSQWGSSQNRLESVISTLTSKNMNLVIARSRIQDADYATEISEITRAQIFQQASNAVLIKTNQIPKFVLELLK